MGNRLYTIMARRASGSLERAVVKSTDYFAGDEP
jgi:hypothetical protein